jgi:hypothetical protein
MKLVFTATRLRIHLQSLSPGHARQPHVTKKKKVVHTDNAALKRRAAMGESRVLAIVSVVHSGA